MLKSIAEVAPELVSFRISFYFFSLKQFAAASISSQVYQKNHSSWSNLSLFPILIQGAIRHRLLCVLFSVA